MAHIGFIMDGNRRWAKENKIPVLHQHEKGVENFKDVVRLCADKGLEVVSFWGLAYKNVVERSDSELNQLYKYLEDTVGELGEEFDDRNIRFETVGDLSLLPEKTQGILADLREKTVENDGMICILALGYGGQREIVQGVKKCFEDGIDPEELDEKTFFQKLDTGRFPAPDLIIRTGSNKRLRHSGYFLYASEYSEYYFTETFWPDFSEEELDTALEKLQKSERNFGK